MHQIYTQQAFPLFFLYQATVEEMLWRIIPNTPPQYLHSLKIA